MVAARVPRSQLSICVIRNGVCSAGVTDMVFVGMPVGDYSCHQALLQCPAELCQELVSVPCQLTRTRHARLLMENGQANGLYHPHLPWESWQGKRSGAVPVAQSICSSSQPMLEWSYLSLVPFFFPFKYISSQSVWSRFGTCQA